MNAPPDRAATLAQTLAQPGLVWGYVPDDQAPGALTSDLPPEDGRFRWLHLNLADQRSLRWLETRAGPAAGARAR